MAKSQVTIDGVQYDSRTAAAKALVAAGKTLSEAAEMTGMTYQTVYANTKGLEKVGVRRVNYRILSLGKRGKRTASEIASKVGVSVSKVVALLKKNNIAVLTKEAKLAAKAAKTTKKTSKKQKVTKPENVIEIPEPVTDIPEDQSAKEAAMADMKASD